MLTDRPTGLFFFCFFLLQQSFYFSHCLRLVAIPLYSLAVESVDFQIRPVSVRPSHCGDRGAPETRRETLD